MAFSHSLYFCIFLMAELVLSSATERPCVASEEQIIRVVNGSMGGPFQEVIVNCLAYRDVRRTVESAIVSGFSDGMEGRRYWVECEEGILLVEESRENATRNTTHCHQCVDSNQLCAEGGGEPLFPPPTRGMHALYIH